MAVLLAIVLLIVAGILYRYSFSSRKQTRKIPGPKGYPIIGSALQIKPNQMHSKFCELAIQYGHIFEVQMAGTKIITLNSVDMINKAFYRDGNKFSGRPTSFMAERLNLNQCVVLRNADKTFNVSKKSFSNGLRAFENGVHAIKGEIDRVMKEIEGFNGQEFEVVGVIHRSLSTLCLFWYSCKLRHWILRHDLLQVDNPTRTTYVRLNGEAATEEDAEQFSVFSYIGDVLMNPVANTLLSNLPILQKIPYYKRHITNMTKAKQKIEETYFYESKETYTYGRIRGLIDRLLQDREENSEASSILTDDIIKPMVLIDVFSGGVSTTSIVLPSIILCLVNHPEYQTKLQEEIDRVIGRERESTINDKSDCPFVEAVVMETMRFITPAPFLLPHLSSEDTEFEGFHVQKKSMVIANVWFIHHDENIWGDPWTFRPERFLDESGKLLPNSHHYMKSWLPFGVGRRKCPGMGMATTRIFLYLTSLFQKWTFIPSPGNCGSCDPRSDNFVLDALFKPRPFHCSAKLRK